MRNSTISQKDIQCFKNNNIYNNNQQLERERMKHENYKSVLRVFESSYNFNYSTVIYVRFMYFTVGSPWLLKANEIA